MRKAILAGIKQAVFNTGFLFGMIVVVLLIFLSSLGDMLAAFRNQELITNGFHAELISRALIADGMTLALPLIAALPFSSSFVDELKCGFVKEYLPRTTRSRYITGKLTACAISGGLVLAAGILAAYVIAALVFSPMEAAIAAPKGTLLAGSGTEAAGYFGELMRSMLLYFCSGAFWATVGLALAVLTNSKYMAYASPFVIYYVLIILYERYFNQLYVICPREWINPSDVWMWGEAGVVLLLLELTVIFGLMFAAAAKRRLESI